MSNGEIIIYETQDGCKKIDVHLEDETVWLTQAQMAQLFGKGRTTITEHIQNIFKEGELDENSVCRNFRHTANDRKTYDVNYYNLDVIISVGYRVKSHQGTQFRIWVALLDSILQLNGRELLTHAGIISHQMALERSAEEYNKYKQEQKNIEQEQSLKEMEEDIKKLKGGL
jgi:hypothetical protein